MKKLITSLLLLTLLTMGSAWALVGDKKTLAYYFADSSNTSITAVAANSNLLYRIYGISLATDTADTVAIKCGTTTMASYHFGATSGLVFNFFPLFFECARNEAIVITKGTGSTDLRATIFYTAD